MQRTNTVTVKLRTFLKLWGNETSPACRKHEVYMSRNGNHNSSNTFRNKAHTANTCPETRTENRRRWQGKVGRVGLRDERNHSLFSYSIRRCSYQHSAGMSVFDHGGGPLQSYSYISKSPYHFLLKTAKMKQNIQRMSNNVINSATSALQQLNTSTITKSDRNSDENERKKRNSSSSNNNDSNNEKQLEI